VLHRPHHLHVVLSLAWLGGLLYPGAQVSAQETLEPVTIEEERDKGEDPLASGATLVMEDAPPSQALGEVLEGIPGVTTMGAGGEGRRKQISIRGLSNQQVQVVWDGIPLNTSLGGGVDLAQIPIWGGENVDVYRGGNGLLGANALGGALHVLPPKSPTSRKASVSLRGGSYGSLGGRLSAEEGTEHWGVRTGLEGTHREGDFTFRDHNGSPRTRRHNGSMDWSWMGGLYGNNLNQHNVRLQTWIHESIRQMPGAEQFPTLDASLSQTRQLGSFTWEPLSMPMGLKQVGVWTHRRTSEYASSSSFLGGRVSNKMDALATGGRIHLRWMPASWVSPQLSLDGSGEVADISLTGIRTPRERFQGGSGASLELGFFRDRLLMTPGVRMDWLSDQGMTVLPKIGAQAQPHRLLTVTVNGSRSYRPPTFEELYFEQGSVRGNPDLGPEEGWSLDGDVRVGTKKHWIRLGGYSMWIQNLILFLPTSAFVLEATDSKSATSHGVEGEAKVSLTRQLALSGGYTFTRAQFKDTGEALPFRSPHTGFGTLQWSHENTRIKSSMVWRSAFPLDRFGQLSEEGRIQIDGEFRHDFSDEFRVLVEAHNLLDKQDAVDDLLQPLPGRTIFVTTVIRL